MAQVNDLKEHEIVDSIHVLEASMRHFFYRAIRGESIGRKEAEIDEDYRQAATLAGMLALDPATTDSLPRLSTASGAGSSGCLGISNLRKVRFPDVRRIKNCR